MPYVHALVRKGTASEKRTALRNAIYDEIMAEAMRKDQFLSEGLIILVTEGRHSAQRGEAADVTMVGIAFPPGKEPKDYEIILRAACKKAGFRNFSVRGYRAEHEDCFLPFGIRI